MFLVTFYVLVCEQAHRWVEPGKKSLAIFSDEFILLGETGPLMGREFL